MPFVATPDWFRSCEILDPASAERPPPSTACSPTAGFGKPSCSIKPEERCASPATSMAAAAVAVHAVLNQIGHTTYSRQTTTESLPSARGLVHGKPPKFVS